MSRLIDADVFMREIILMQKANKEIPLLEEQLNDPDVNNYEYGQSETFDLIIEHLEKMETAYNVDKVVEELACNSRFIDDINEHSIKCISCVIGQKTAIEIVRKGGVHE